MGLRAPDHLHDHLLPNLLVALQVHDNGARGDTAKDEDTELQEVARTHEADYRAVSMANTELAGLHNGGKIEEIVR